MVHWSDGDLQLYRERSGTFGSPKMVPKKIALPKRLQMNKTEKRYAEFLDQLKLTGEVESWWFESWKCRISPNWKGSYTPDFLALHNDDGLLGEFGTKLIFHEVKGGYIREDALKAFKAAAEMYPCFGWRMVQWKSGAWKIIQEFC